MERLTPEKSLLVVVDVQDRLAAAMPPASMERLVANSTILLEAARILGVRVMASEQYPRGLGPTVGALASKMSVLGVSPIDKVDFDACGEPRFALALSAVAPRSVVLVGMEAHVCVFQTARELVRRGYETYVVADAVASRSEENRALGLDLCAHAGAYVAPAETITFDWLARAGSEAFKTVSKLLK
jgi:nicotinamidase-related amidase